MNLKIADQQAKIDIGGSGPVVADDKPGPARGLQQVAGERHDSIAPELCNYWAARLRVTDFIGRRAAVAQKCAAYLGSRHAQIKVSKHVT
ncbi:hypothetical protein AB1J11_028025 (plasmid) [Agrobacterium arsenijevicii]|uniref:hypothetical protein n=1 Tax=Agrobacterium arsenijevicii TaxID=1585697 RepID=UPI0034588AE1